MHACCMLDSLLGLELCLLAARATRLRPPHAPTVHCRRRQTASGPGTRCRCRCPPCSTSTTNTSSSCSSSSWLTAGGRSRRGARVCPTCCGTRSQTRWASSGMQRGGVRDNAMGTLRGAALDAVQHGVLCVVVWQRLGWGWRVAARTEQRALGGWREGQRLGPSRQRVEVTRLWGRCCCCGHAKVGGARQDHIEPGITRKSYGCIRWDWTCTGQAAWKSGGMQGGVGAQPCTHAQA